MQGPMFYGRMNQSYGCECERDSYARGYMAAIQMVEMMQMMQMIRMMQMRQYGDGFPMGGPQGCCRMPMDESMGMYLGAPNHMPYSPMPWGPGPSDYGPRMNGGGYTNRAYPVSPNYGGGGGSDAVELGRRFLGENSIDIKGRMPNFTAAGGQTNNCADFVSACLESTGALSGHHVNVSEMERSLVKQGYRRISAAEAKPGDVYITESRSHTELVAAPGATRLIGSNNDRPGHQVISEKPHNGSGVFYTRG